MRKLIIILLFVLLPFIIHSEELKFKNFNAAKRALTDIYINNQIDFYCGCPYSYENVDNKTITTIDREVCGYIPNNDNERANRIEWEHVMPASRFAKDLACWNEYLCEDKKGKKFKGRSCCQKIDSKFNEMEGDINNLRPAIGELNAARSNFNFGIVTSDNIKTFGTCNFKVDKKNKLTEPRKEIRNEIANIYYYMSTTYNISLTEDEISMLDLFW